MTAAQNKHYSNRAINVEGETPYIDALTQVQEYIANNYAETLARLDEGNLDEDTGNKLRDYINRYIVENKVTVAIEGITRQALIERIYSDMAEYGFLTELLKSEDIEEININGWQDVEVRYRDGRRDKWLPENGFMSEQHAIDLVKRILHRQSNRVLDESSPIADGHINANIRISAVHDSLLDEGIGIVASIRFISKAKQTKETMLTNTATSEMLYLLENCFRYGTSICIAGATGSGKTNTAGYILSTLPDTFRIVSLEEGSREIDLRKYDENGNVKNNVVQMITRSAENEKFAVTLDDLLRESLRLDPDAIFIGEMRSKEAYNAQEAARTGFPVLTTVHSKSAEASYTRMVTLAKTAYDFDDEFLEKLMVEAFPIIVHQTCLPDNQRVLTQIIEGVGFVNGELKTEVLYEYVVDSVEYKEVQNTAAKVTYELIDDEEDEDSEGEVIQVITSVDTEQKSQAVSKIIGHFEKRETISTRLQNALKQAGMPRDVLEKIVLVPAGAVNGK